MSFHLRTLLTTAMLLTLALPARADEVSDKGRAVFKQYQRSVITVQVVIKSKISMTGAPARPTKPNRASPAR